MHPLAYPPGETVLGTAKNAFLIDISRLWVFLTLNGEP
jgi:hypothetical protein